MSVTIELPISDISGRVASRPSIAWCSRMHLLTVTMISLAWFDAAATYCAISYYGADEGNPVLHSIQGAYGTAVMCAARFTFGAVMTSLLYLMATRSRSASQRRFSAAAVVVGTVVLLLVMMYHVGATAYAVHHGYINCNVPELKLANQLDLCVTWGS